MAAVTPFGESFGDPRRYMGQSPLAQVGQALKTGLILTALNKSGAIAALDRMGVKPNAQGGFNYQMPKPAGAVAPTTPPMGAQPVVPPQAGAAPMMPAAIPDAAPGVQITPFGQEAPSNVQINTLAPPPPDAGRQILEGTFRPQSSAVDVQNENDFSPLAPDTSNQFAVSGNDYQQIPGYGKLQRIAGQLMGMG
jgi:hypothetical protein